MSNPNHGLQKIPSIEAALFSDQTNQVEGFNEEAVTSIMENLIRASAPPSVRSTSFGNQQPSPMSAMGPPSSASFPNPNVTIVRGQAPPQTLSSTPGAQVINVASPPRTQQPMTKVQLPTGAPAPMQSAVPGSGANAAPIPGSSSNQIQKKQRIDEVINALKGKLPEERRPILASLLSNLKDKKITLHEFSLQLQTLMKEAGIPIQTPPPPITQGAVPPARGAPPPSNTPPVRGIPPTNSAPPVRGALPPTNSVAIKPAPGPAPQPNTLQPKPQPQSQPQPGQSYGPSPAPKAPSTTQQQTPAVTQSPILNKLPLTTPTVTPSSGAIVKKIDTPTTAPSTTTPVQAPNGPKPDELTLARAQTQKFLFRIQQICHREAIKANASIFMYLAKATMEYIRRILEQTYKRQQFRNFNQAPDTLMDSSKLIGASKQQKVNYASESRPTKEQLALAQKNPLYLLPASDQLKYQKMHEEWTNLKQQNQEHGLSQEQTARWNAVSQELHHLYSIAKQKHLEIQQLQQNTPPPPPQPPAPEAPATTAPAQTDDKSKGKGGKKDPKKKGEKEKEKEKGKKESSSSASSSSASSTSSIKETTAPTSAQQAKPKESEQDMHRVYLTVKDVLLDSALEPVVLQRWQTKRKNENPVSSEVKRRRLA